MRRSPTRGVNGGSAAAFCRGHKSLKRLVQLGGLEPPTSGSTSLRSGFNAMETLAWIQANRARQGANRHHSPTQSPTRSGRHVPVPFMVAHHAIPTP